MTRRFTTPEHLDRSPELAVLAILESTLAVLTCAVVAAHPDLCHDDERPYWVSPPPDSVETRRAQALLDSADRLHAAIRAYYRAVADALKASLPQGDDIPF